MKYRQARANIALFFVALIWGVAFVAQSVGVNWVGPLTFNAVRLTAGGLALLPVVFFMDRQKKARGGEKGPGFRDKKLLRAGALCGAALCVAIVLQQYGIMYTTVGRAGFITALYIIIVPVMGVFLGRPAGFNIWIGALVAVVGLYLLSGAGSGGVTLGDVLVFICAFFFAVHIMLTDRFSPQVDSVRLACLQFIIAGLICTAGAFIFEEPEISGIVGAWLPLAYAAFMSTGVAYTLQIVMQKDTDPTLASLIMSFESVFSALAGWLLLNQRLSARELAGCALMFAAVIFAQIPTEKIMVLFERKSEQGEH